MSRLIDADALMEYVLNLKGKMIGCNDIARFPTAYDTDRVIEQLEEQKQEEGNVTLTKIAYNTAIEDAIDIVKKGGV